MLERGQTGGRWRTERWDSLRFQFPNWSLELPGYAYSGDDPNGFAHWREILSVIEDYAAASQAPVRELSEEEPSETEALPASVSEVEALDLRRENVAAIIWATTTSTRSYARSSKSSARTLARTPGSSC